MGLKATAKYMIRQFPFIYPRRLIYSCEDWINSQRKKKGAYFSQRGPWYKKIYPGDFICNKEPQTLGSPNPGAFYMNKAYTTNQASLFYLQNSFLLGHKGMVLTASHELFQEFTHYFGIATLGKFLFKNPFYTFTKSVKKIPGTGAVLVSPESHNYYHWLSDVLPRIKLYEPVLDHVDHFCVSSNVPSKFLEVLKDFGIPESKILFVKDMEKLQFDHLYVSSLPGSEGRSPKWAVDYIRETLIKSPVPVQPEKKLYFKRGDRAERKLLNESAVITLLQSNGFEIADPGELSIYEQICLMQQAAIVVSAHGAALSNLLFSPDKTTVIELFSPDYFRTDCYYTLSSLNNLDYWYIAGDKPQAAKWGDIIINEELLLNTIKHVNDR